MLLYKTVDKNKKDDLMEKSKSKWCLSPEQKADLTDMLKTAGFNKPEIDRMINRICKTKQDVSQQIMTRCLNARSKEAFVNWINEFSVLCHGTGVSKEQVREALLVNPMLFFSSPKTLYSHAKDIQDRLKAEKIDVPMSVLLGKNVQKSGLLARSSTTVATHIIDLVKAIEKRAGQIDRSSFVQRVLRDRSQVLMQLPRTIGRNIDQTVRLICKNGIPLSRSDYVMATTKHTGLLYQSPETVCRHFSILYGLYANSLCTVHDKEKSAGKPEEMVRKILKDPVRLSLGEDNLAQRWQLACKIKEET